MSPDTLKTYKKKRDFRKTPEPAGIKKEKTGRKGPIFVIQKHDATRLHYDFRLEAGGVLKSWAVPKGPSLDPEEKRLAVRTEDHPFEYAEFEGIIPEGEYGAGPVLIWDKGTFENITGHKGKTIPLEEGIEKGHISFILYGKKLKGAFALTRIRKDKWGKEDWILVKMRDEYAKENGKPVEEEFPGSVKTGKKIEDIARGAGERIWHSNRAEKEIPGPEVDQQEFQKAIAKLRKSPQPEWISPMLATLSEEKNIPSGDWLFEPKLDGERCLIFKKNGKVKLSSRNRKDLNGHYPELVDAFKEQNADNFIADGEIVAFENGLPSFSKLQPRMQLKDPEEELRSGIEVFYYLFDLVYFDGYDITRLELRYRKKILSQILSWGGLLGYLSDVSGNGRNYYEDTCKQGYEGTIGKRAASPYIRGRTREWLKFKCFKEQEFVICGWTSPEGGRIGFGALVLGYYEKGKLEYAGKVGTGFTDYMLKTLSEKFKGLEQKQPPFPDYKKNRLIPRTGAHWLRPELVAEVAFSEWTPEGLLRHPSFKGLREDKSAAEVIREKPS